MDIYNKRLPAQNTDPGLRADPSIDDLLQASGYGKDSTQRENLVNNTRDFQTDLQPATHVLSTGMVMGDFAQELDAHMQETTMLKDGFANRGGMKGAPYTLPYTMTAGNSYQYLDIDNSAEIMAHNPPPVETTSEELQFEYLVAREKGLTDEMTGFSTSYLDNPQQFAVDASYKKYSGYHPFIKLPMPQATLRTGTVNPPMQAQAFQSNPYAAAFEGGDYGPPPSYPPPPPPTDPFSRPFSYPFVPPTQPPTQPPPPPPPPSNSDPYNLDIPYVNIETDDDATPIPRTQPPTARATNAETTYFTDGSTGHTLGVDPAVEKFFQETAGFFDSGYVPQIFQSKKAPKLFSTAPFRPPPDTNPLQPSYDDDLQRPNSHGAVGAPPPTSKSAPRSSSFMETNQDSINGKRGADVNQEARKRAAIMESYLGKRPNESEVEAETRKRFVAQNMTDEWLAYNGFHVDATTTKQIAELALRKWKHRQQIQRAQQKADGRTQDANTRVEERHASLEEEVKKACHQFFSQTRGGVPTAPMSSSQMANEPAPPVEPLLDPNQGGTPVDISVETRPEEVLSWLAVHQDLYRTMAAQANWYEGMSKTERYLNQNQNSTRHIPIEQMDVRSAVIRAVQGMAREPLTDIEARRVLGSDPHVIEAVRQLIHIYNQSADHYEFKELSQKYLTYSKQHADGIGAEMGETFLFYVTLRVISQYVQNNRARQHSEDLMYQRREQKRQSKGRGSTQQAPTRAPAGTTVEEQFEPEQATVTPTLTALDEREIDLRGHRSIYRQQPVTETTVNKSIEKGYETRAKSRDKRRQKKE